MTIERRKGPAPDSQVPKEQPTEGRLAKKRRLTRARLLEAAYQVMAESGVDDAKVKDITDKADVGFGTFYNYFETKDELANQVLDCVIHDLGRRNIVATRGLGSKDPTLVMPVSIRLMMRAIIASPMWRWWAMRPDLLADRMREGFGPFGMRDMREGMERGFFTLTEEEIAPSWALAVWVMVGGIHGILIGGRAPDSEMFVTQTIMRLMGMSTEMARCLSTTELPPFPSPDIDWRFQLGG